jgi:hypothetical protein
MPESLVIPAGADSATLTIYPVASAELVGAESVVLALLPSPDYQVGAPASATVNIDGNTVPARVRLSGVAQVRLEWPATPGKFYGIAFKDDATETGWRVLPTEIQASASTAYYQESAGVRRFYHVFEAR